MNPRTYIDRFYQGNMTAFARKNDLSVPHVRQLVTERRNVGVKFAVRIQKATRGRVTCESIAKYVK